MTPIKRYIKDGEVPDKPKEATLVRKRASNYSNAEGKLYCCGFSTPLLKCLEMEESEYVLAEIYEGMTPIKRCIKDGEVPKNPKEDTLV